jgi:hypothetical protein
LRKGAEGSVATPDGLMFMVLGLLVSGVAIPALMAKQKTLPPHR